MWTTWDNKTIKLIDIDNNTVTATNHDYGGLYIAPNNVADLILTTNITGGSISSNKARNAGGIGATASGSNSPEHKLNITGTIISGNAAGTDTAGGQGGGFYLTGGNLNTVTIDKCWIKGNMSYVNGGGISNSANTTITNSMITGNITHASYADGGGIQNSGTISVHSSTVAGNYSSRNGGGWNGGGTITNSIFWGNTANGSNDQINGSPTVTYSDVEGGYTGTGNINLDPVFDTPAQASSGTPTTLGDFHIRSSSNVIDQGILDTGVPNDDIDGVIRDIHPDMGADEYGAPYP